MRNEDLSGKTALGRQLSRWRQTVHYYLSGLVRRIDEHHSLLLASGLAFSLIICIIPLILILFAALGIIIEKTSVVHEIEGFIDRAIPYREYAASVKEAVLNRLNEFASYRNHAGIVGVLGLLFATSGLFSSMRTVLNRIFHTRRSQSLLVGKLHDMGLILTVILFVLVYTMVLPGMEVAREVARRTGWQDGFPFLLGAASFILLVAGFFLVYLAVPQKRLPWRVVLVSSLSAGFFWHLAQRVFGFYLSHFATLTRIYGTYALLIVVAFWIYYTAIVFVVGAEIGQLYRERRENRLYNSSRSHFFAD